LHLNTELVTKIMNKKIVLATNERGDCFKCRIKAPHVTN
jgi:hypothetical protein